MKLSILAQLGFADDIIPFGSSWEYLHPQDATNPGFADRDFRVTWPTPSEYDGPVFSSPSPAPLGYGGMVATDIVAPREGKRYTAYFRKTVITTADYEDLEFEILANDGGFLYINGDLVAGVNMEFNGDAYFVRAKVWGEEVGAAKVRVRKFLEAGEHTIAFSVHNHAPESKDLSFDLRFGEFEGNFSELTWVRFDGEVTIVKAAASVSGDFDIPDEIEGFPVTVIGDGAFQGRENLTGVSIPESVREIGRDAFRDCIGLTEVTIPGSVKSTGRSAFSGCVALREVTLQDGVISVSLNSFQDCPSLETVMLPASLEVLQDDAFSGCSSLESVLIPEGVTRISRRTFQSCGLTAVVLPDSVVELGEKVFAGCEKMANVVLSENVAEVSRMAFEDCRALISVTIPDSSVAIGERAFEDCENLVEVKLGTGLESVGTNAFRNTKVVFREEGSLQYLANLNAAFLTDARSVAGHFNIPDQLGGKPVKSVNAFSFNQDITGVTFPTTVRVIGDSAFEGCTKLDGVVIPEGVREIGQLAFSRCRSLEEVTFPESLTVLGSSAFSQCESLRSINIPDGVEVIESLAFWECNGFTEITIPQGVEAIHGGAFFGCQNLERVMIEGKLDSIGFRAFQDCANLAAVTFLKEAPDEVGFRAFEPGPEVFVKPEHAPSFGGAGATWQELPVRIIDEVEQPIEILSAGYRGDKMVLQFTGRAERNDWVILSSVDLEGFADGNPVEADITEIFSGRYEAVIELEDGIERAFFRVR